MIWQSMKSYRVHKVPDAPHMPAQAMTISLQPKGLRGKKCKISLVYFQLWNGLSDGKDLADWTLIINLTNKLLFYNPNICTMYSLYRNKLLQTLGIKIRNLTDIIQLILITLLSVTLKVRHFVWRRGIVVLRYHCYGISVFFRYLTPSIL